LVGFILQVSVCFSWQPIPSIAPIIGSQRSSTLKLSNNVRDTDPTITSTTDNGSSPHHVVSGDDDDLCKRTLDAALSKMAAISEHEFAAKFNKRRLRLVEVKESSIPGAGLGLFAREKIKSGTIISFYPAHLLGIDLGDSIIRRELAKHGESGKIDVDQEDEVGDCDDAACLHYVVGSRPLMNTNIIDDLGGETIFINVDPNQDDSPGFASHRINDGATVMANDEASVLSYYDATRKSKNCCHVPFGPSPLLATVATRKIKKGDELFTTYGCSYWLDTILDGGEEETDMTEAIVEEAKQVAMDVLKGMRSAEVTNANEAAELQAVFDLP